jgi:hypothetical protein
MNSKITEQHRSRPACIYVRQSTPGQVLHHQESTERQYALRGMALELGWSESAIRTLDRDLGMTGRGTGVCRKCASSRKGRPAAIGG